MKTKENGRADSSVGEFTIAGYTSQFLFLASPSENSAIVERRKREQEVEKEGQDFLR